MAKIYQFSAISMAIFVIVLQKQLESSFLRPFSPIIRAELMQQVGWMHHSTSDGQITPLIVCFTRSLSRCFIEFLINIKACSSYGTLFYVYQLKKPLVCEYCCAAYCAVGSQYIPFLFRCDNDMLIHRFFLCDRHNDYGDQSDEKSYSTAETTTTVAQRGANVNHET